MRQNDAIVIMGNGPSMTGVDPRNFGPAVDTFGMKNAYRFFRRISWWPTYFACFDYTAAGERIDEFRALILDPEVTVEQFFFLKKICESDRIRAVQLQPGKPFEGTFNTFGDGGNTATNCAHVAACLGYRKILLIGVDCNWKHVPQTPGAYEVADVRASCDYFISDYKKVGEKYNAPMPDTYHFPGWRNFAEYAEGAGLEVVNCSPESALECFRKSTLSQELASI